MPSSNSTNGRSRGGVCEVANSACMGRPVRPHVRKSSGCTFRPLHEHSSTSAGAQKRPDTDATATSGKRDVSETLLDTNKVFSARFFVTEQVAFGIYVCVLHIVNPGRRGSFDQSLERGRLR
jgi:hypothetical protein